LKLNEHIEHDWFEHAALGLEGIVSKRKGSWYQLGRSRDWVKAKNPKAPGSDAGWLRMDWGRSWSPSSGRKRPGDHGHIRSHGCRDLLVYCISGRCHHSATLNGDCWQTRRLCARWCKADRI
jgi:hypothetical protein